MRVRAHAWVYACVCPCVRVFTCIISPNSFQHHALPAIRRTRASRAIAQPEAVKTAGEMALRAHTTLPELHKNIQIVFICCMAGSGWWPLTRRRKENIKLEDPYCIGEMCLCWTLQFPSPSLSQGGIGWFTAGMTMCVFPAAWGMLPAFACLSSSLHVCRLAVHDCVLNSVHYPLCSCFPKPCRGKKREGNIQNMICDVPNVSQSVRVTKQTKTDVISEITRRRADCQRKRTERWNFWRARWRGKGRRRGDSEKIIGC